MMMLHFLFVLLVAIVLSSECVAFSITKPKLNEIQLSRQRRWLVGFAQFVEHYTGRSALDYNNYGCW